MPHLILNLQNYTVFMRSLTKLVSSVPAFSMQHLQKWQHHKKSHAFRALGNLTHAMYRHHVVLCSLLDVLLCACCSYADEPGCGGHGSLHVFRQPPLACHSQGALYPPPPPTTTWCSMAEPATLTMTMTNSRLLFCTYSPLELIH